MERVRHDIYFQIGGRSSLYQQVYTRGIATTSVHKQLEGPNGMPLQSAPVDFLSEDELIMREAGKFYFTNYGIK